MAERRHVRDFCLLLRNLILSVILYGSIYTVALFYEGGSQGLKAFKYAALELPSSSSGTVGLPISGLPGPPSRQIRPENINPNANWFNRPASLVKIKYDYMGPRPNIDTVANLTRIIENCRGSKEVLEKMGYLFNCLQYLVEGESDYFYIPEVHERASSKSPKSAEYLNADGKGNTLSAYLTYKAPSKSSSGTCFGPIIPFHVYWTGPATWRVELFIKSYFFTQNIPCSRLWIWLDSDKNPRAVDDMLNHDPLFAKFRPFVERGDISLHEWNFPSRIPLPKGDNTDGRGYYKHPRPLNEAGESLIADGIIRDAVGQEWLVLTQRQKTFLPVAVSDAVRFVVLHLYGGSYYDMDVMLLRDMRPLLVGKEHSFAERWGQHPTAGDYNTCVTSLTANSSLSSYLVRGGVRMGLNFHPRVMGRMAAKDGRNKEFLMMETAVFDPIWFEWNWEWIGRCTVPCFRDYASPFKGASNAFPHHDEWESYDGPQMNQIIEIKPQALEKGPGIGLVTTFDKDKLAKTEYRIEEDNYPPTNRTLEHFFRGSWSYHAHNQWRTTPEPSSWFNVVQLAHNAFFDGSQTNAYGEKWTGPEMLNYELSWECT